MSYSCSPWSSATGWRRPPAGTALDRGGRKVQTGAGRVRHLELFLLPRSRQVRTNMQTGAEPGIASQTGGLCFSHPGLRARTFLASPGRVCEVPQGAVFHSPPREVISPPLEMGA